MGCKRSVSSLIAISYISISILTLNFADQASAASQSERISDFNGDGYEDLAVGVPFESLGPNTVVNGGSVNLIYGSLTGISALPASGTGLSNQQWNLNSPFVEGNAQNAEEFGNAIATGDFNGDGYSDIAIGIHRHNSAQGSGDSRGAVKVIYGSASGLIASSSAPIQDQLFSQDSPKINGVGNLQDNFGEAVAVGDFNNDGYDDLAVGVPNDDVSRNGSIQVDAGAVNVIYGSSEGLSAISSGDGGRTDQLWTQESGIKDIAEPGDHFGSTLATGDFNGDGYEDLAVGVIGEGHVPNDDFSSDAGAVNIIYGSPDGLSAAFVQDQFFQQGFLGIDGIPAGDDMFGFALTTGDFDADGYADLAVGVPGENIIAGNGLPVGAGAIQVIYGSANGLSAVTRDDQILYQGYGGIEGTPEDTDMFGFALTTGDYNNDGFADLVVGTPQDGDIPQSGSVSIIYGSSEGLSADVLPDALFSQDSPGMMEAAGAGDNFGYSLATGDYDGDGYDDLAIGAPGEDVNHDSIADAGSVSVIYGSSQGLSATGTADGTGRMNQLWTQNSPYIKGVAEEIDRLGNSLG